MKRVIGRLVLALLALVLIVGHADAQRRGGGRRGGGGGFRGGGGGFRGTARASVTRPRGNVGRSSFARPSNPISRPAPIGAVNRGNVVNTRPGNVIANRPGNIVNNRPGNIVNNRPIYNRDVNVIAGGRWDANWDGCCYYGPRYGAAAGFAAGALAAASVGSVVYSVPPSCTTTVVNGITYEQCGSTWYKPEFAGTTTSYVVVNPP
jgi:hypothetical protein